MAIRPNFPSCMSIKNTACWSVRLQGGGGVVMSKFAQTTLVSSLTTLHDKAPGPEFVGVLYVYCLYLFYSF